MNLLLISNSTNPGEAYLDYPKHSIREFLARPVIVLLSHTPLTFSYDIYEEKVSERFREIGHGLYQYIVSAIAQSCKEAEAIATAEETHGNSLKT